MDGRTENASGKLLGPAPRAAMLAEKLAAELR
jgi:hypothetical protein